MDRYRPFAKGFGFVELDSDGDEKPEIGEARPVEEIPGRKRRLIGKEAIDQTNKEKNNE